jgi:beta-phosphoglucomutase
VKSVSKFRAFLFDMDGVIIDSNPIHREVWEVYNRRHGVETTAAMHEVMYGKRNDQLIREFLGQHLNDAEVFAHGAAKEQLYRNMMRPHVKQHLVPGVREFIVRHKDLGMAVASNAEGANIDLILDEAALRPYFPVSVNGSQVNHGKPAPDIYLKAAEMLGTTPDRCVVFEDSYAGVAAGVAAGMRVVGLSTTHDELPGVDLLIKDFTDPALEAWLA